MNSNTENNTISNSEYNLIVRRGMQAWANGNLLLENPYPAGTEKSYAWTYGYESASEESC